MTLKKRNLWIVLGVVVALVIILLSLVQFYVDYMWFSEVGYTEVFLKELITKFQLGLPVFLIILGGTVIFSNQLIKRADPENVVRFKNRSKRYKWLYSLLVLGGSLLVSVLVVNQIWYEVLEFINQTSFGLTDPIFNQDISFYFFTKPFFQTIYLIIRSLYLVSALITIAFYAYQNIFKNKINVFDQDQNFDDLKANTGKYLKDSLKKNIRLIGILLGVFLILLIPQYFFEIYDYLYSTTGMVFGPGAADIDIGVKVVILKAGLALIFGIIAIIGGLKSNFKLILSGPIVLLVITGLGGIGQSIYESLVVVPNQFVKEEEYIGYNIEFTQTAYDLLDVEVVEFSGSQKLTAEDIEENEITINNIPINDQIPTKDMYNSLQGIRNYYQFYDVDVDRYMIDGEYTQVFLGGREINNDLLPDKAKTWVNEHLKYTHGFGVAMSPVNKTNASGQPELIIKDIPPKTDYSEIAIEEPRIYFGESEYDYIKNSNGRVVTFFDKYIKEKQFEGETWKQIVDEIVSELPENVYLSFDIDGLDPKLCPNTGTPVQGGLETEQVYYLLRKIIKQKKKLIGFDLNEVGVSTNEWDENVGARILFKLCNLLILSDEQS